MIRYLLLVVALTSAMSSSAQLGIMAGGNGSAIRYHGQLGKVKNSSVLGISAGIMCRFTYNRMISIEPSLAYVPKGAQYASEAVYIWSYVERDKLHYLQLSLPLLYNYAINKDINLSIGIGPYLAYLVRAHSHFDVQDGSTYKEDRSIGGANTDDFKRFDAGGRIVGGMSYKRWLVRLNYDYGFTDVRPGEYESIKNRSTGAGLVRMF